MEDKIELTHINYKDYIPINIIAFSFAYSGAQGEPGGVIIINDKGQIFHFNYLDDKLIKEEIDEIFPFINNYYLVKFEEKYQEINMGMGNKLLVEKSFYPKVEQIINEIKNPSSLYCRWKNIILNALKNKY